MSNSPSSSLDESPNLERRPVQKVRIDDEMAGQRIDNFLRTQLPGVPKSRVYRILRKGEVRVNGGRVRAEYKLQAGDEVRIPPVHVRAEGAPPSPGAANQVAERILFEDKLMLVVDKPSGVAVHGGSGISHGVIELLRFARPELKDLSLVHRLDKETSGCLVLAKRRSMLRTLHQRFRDGTVEKNYLALAVGDWQLGDYKVDAPLLVTHRKNGERHVVVRKDGKLAETRIRLSRTYGKFSLLQCQPMSGRTHQIRVHLQSLEYPIAGDPRYGDVEVNKKAARHGLKRLFLHAQSISFPDGNGNELHFTSPLADDLQQFLDKGIPRYRRD